MNSGDRITLMCPRGPYADGKSFTVGTQGTLQTHLNLFGNSFWSVIFDGDHTPRIVIESCLIPVP